MDAIKEQTRADRQKELQRFLMEIEAYRRQVDELSRQVQLLDARLIELSSTRQSLDSLKDGKEGSDLLVPIGSGCFIHAGLREADRVIVGIGAGVSVEETASRAKEILKEREGKMEESLKKLQDALLEANDRLLGLESAYAKLMGGMQA